ncbi:MAG: SSU ribosomal protein S2p (SAe) [uncultured Sulfurovum sp.]|uniref:Small ribosomal subunit protein uS2 n=2 Tax=Sulfurovum TaxID=265570 RepID=A0A6S6TCW1_9BACT|nr:MAG: SSU ribosomal protein S2p (SAe) [uncultured Sulfurovum sp.]
MVTMKDLLECGVHFGHQTRRWNPKMKKFIFGARKNIYIIDLQKTLRYFKYTYNVVRDAAAEGQTVLFVGTKKQARQAVKEHAERCGMPYVATRWLGGMLTNYPTMKKSIRKLEIIEQMEENGQLDMLTKKEALMLLRKKEKLTSYLEGFRHMKKLPDMMFVIDAVKEHIAVKEAKRMGMKVVAPLDTNCDPDVVDYPIPGNDDAIRSINLFCKEMAEAIIEGKAAYAEANGGSVDEVAGSDEVAALMGEAAAEDAAAPATTEAVAALSAAKSAPKAEETKAETVTEEAPKAETATASSEDKGDDLTKIVGVGKVYQGKLNDEGFYTFDDVANMNEAQIQVMEEKYSFKGDFKDAVASAKELAKA